jgi:biotin carboxylase
MHKILLVDTNFSSSPIYNYLVKNSNEVFVVGGNPNDFLARSAKNYINIDYSNIDKMRVLIESLNIKYIVPGCNDLSYEICSELNSDGKFPGLDICEVTETINNKEKFRAFAIKISLQVPRVISLNQVNDIWPLIVKPVDAYSGRGITIVYESERNTLDSAIKYAEEYSRTKTCIIEEYIEGQLYSHSAFISNGEIVVDFIVEENSTANPFVVDTSRVVYDFTPEILLQIREAISLMVKELNLVDGLIHTQFIKKAGSFWLIEITRRCPGDLYSQLIELSTGLPYAEIYARPFLNQHIEVIHSSLSQYHVMRHTISQPDESIFGSLKFNFPLQIEKLIPISMAGDKVKSSPFGRIALLFIKTNSSGELSDIYSKTLMRKLYSIQ